MAAFDGKAIKGKTKGKLIGNGKVEGIETGGTKAAGVTNEQKKKLGRNLAKVANQK